MAMDADERTNLIIFLVEAEQAVIKAAKDLANPDGRSRLERMLKVVQAVRELEQAERNCIHRDEQPPEEHVA